MENKRKLPRTRRTLLIPPSIIDPASQRLFVISLFMLIQAWKVYDIILLKNGYTSSGILGLSNTQFSFVAKYFIIDGLFLWSLPLLNIPYLTFGPFHTSLQILTLSFITLFLASDFAVPITSLLLPIWNRYFSKEATLSGGTVSSHQIHDMDLHFKGKHTIKFLPDSTAKFNPFSQKHCIHFDTIEQVFIPIEFNATDIGFLQLQRISPNNEISYLNFTSHEIKKLLKKDTSHLTRNEAYIKDQKIMYIEVGLTEPGYYRISQVKDNKKVNIRSYKSGVFLPYCPFAKFSENDIANSGDDKCFNEESAEIYLDVFGVPPLKLSVNTNIDNHFAGTLDKTVQSDDEFVSPLSLGGISKEDMNDLKWLQAERISVPFKAELTKAGTYSYHIDKISDAFGNELVYNPKFEDPEVLHKIVSHGSPVISLIDSKPGYPLTVGGHKSLLFTVLGGFQKADSPYEIEMEYIHPTNPALNYAFTKEFISSNSFSVEKAGEYILKKAKTKYCSCDIVEERVVVKEASIPSVSIDSEPIIDKCAATTGYEFNFSFTGSPPYQIVYEVFRNNSNQLSRVSSRQQVLNSDSNSFHFDYKAPTEGNYVIKFLTLKDFYYKNGIQLDHKLHTYCTYFTPKSKLSFDSSHYPGTLCLNSSVSVPLTFNGKPPYSFSYDLIYQDKVIDTFTLNDLKDETLILKTSSFAKGGEYWLKLSDASDQSNCDVEFEGSSYRIHVREDVPKIKFSEKTSNITIAEGEVASLGLDISSASKSRSFSLKYLFEDSNGNVKFTTVNNVNSLKVKKEGRYSLYDFSYDGCPGEIEVQNAVTIDFFPTPKLFFDIHSNDIVELPSIKHEERKFEVKSICENCEKRITLEAEGELPFSIDYSIRHPNGKVERLTADFNGYFAVFDLLSSMKGSFKYSFDKIYDRNYPRENFHNLKEASFDPIEVSYVVKQLPNAYFGKGKSTRACQANLKSPEALNPILINLVGEPPFDVDFTLSERNSFKSEKFKVTDIQTNLYKYFEVYENLSLGEYVLNMDKVKDGCGCVSSELSEANSITIEITEVPKIKKVLKKEHLCVGDHIVYELEGVPPFNIFYSFNNKKQKAESGPTFSRLASAPGKLSIIGLSDSSQGCLLNFTTPSMVESYGDLELQIFDIPSVSIDQGEYVIQDIHEGEQAEVTFSFKGIPPFNLTYIRTLETSGTKTKKSKVVEKHTVENIWEYEYTINTDLEGTYEAIEIADAFCVARRELK